MIGFLRDLFRILPGIAAAIFIGVVSTLFLVFPRVVNWLADLLGNMGDPLDLGQGLIHLGVALLIWAILGYFFIARPIQRFRLARRTRGLLVRRGQGIGFMDTESVRQQIYAAVARVSEVQGMEVSVINELGRAEVHLNILSGNRINGAAKKAEIRREVKRVVEDQLGVQLAGEPVINIKLVPIFEDLSFAAPADAPFASAYSGIQRLPAPIVPARPGAKDTEADADSIPAKATVVEAAKEPARPAPKTEAEAEPAARPIDAKPAPEPARPSSEPPLFTRRPFTPSPPAEPKPAAEPVTVIDASPQSAAPEVAEKTEETGEARPK